MLILPGGLAVAETAFRYIHRFEPRYRVLAPDLPRDDRDHGAAGGWPGASWCGPRVSRGCHLIGGSYSGLVAQCLLRHAPELVAKLVLSDTGVPRHSRARLYAATYLPIISHLPLRAVRWAVLLRRGPGAAGAAASARVLVALLRRRIASMSRAAYLSHLAIWLDFDRNYQFSAHDLANWSGSVFIIDAEHDSLFGQDERRILRTLYEDAQVYTFAESTHGASLARDGRVYRSD